MMAHYTAQPVANNRFSIPSLPEEQVLDGLDKMNGWSFGKSFIGFLKCVADARNGNRAEKYAAETRLEKVYKTGYKTTATSSVQKATMGESSGTVGGYLVPIDFSMQLMDTIAEDSFIYPRATVIPMLSSMMQCPKINAETAQTAGTTSFFGGVNFTWGSEQAPSQTEPTLGQVELRAWDLLGYAKISNQMLMDMGPLGEQYLIKLFGRAAAWYSEYAFLNGTGSAAMMPLGVINAPATVIITRAGATDIAAVDISGMAASLLPLSWKSAIWATNPSTLIKIMKLSAYQMNQYAGSTEYPGEQGLTGTLLTRPLYVTDKLPALGTKGDLVLMDPRLYVIGNRMEVVVDVSPHYLFSTNQTEFRIWLRLDGKPQVSSSITLANAATIVSPFVVLL